LTTLQVEMLPKQIDLMNARQFEVLFSGAFRAGKTRAGCYKLLQWASVPGSFVGLCRKTYTSLKHTTLRTLLKPDGPLPAVLPPGAYKHNKTDHVISIKGGGEILYFGFDHPERMGSLGFDAVLIDEGIELDEDEYTMLLGRCSGQALGYRQIVTVTNPGSPGHFLHGRFYETPDETQRLIETNSLENFFLPRQYIEQLQKLTGTDYERYVLGKWTAYEGLVYRDFSRAVHVCERPGPWQRVIIGVDEGFTHPGVALVVGIDGDGRGHVMREFYQTQVLPADFVARVKAMAGDCEPKLERAYIPPEAAGMIADLKRQSVPAMKAKNAVMDGIRYVTNALMIRGDGRPGLTIGPACVDTIREFEAYCWRKGKDEPVKEDDHAMDALRYALFSMRRGKLLFGPLSQVVKQLDEAEGVVKPAEKPREPGPHIIDQPLVEPAVMAEIEAGDDENRARILEDATAWE